MKRFSEQLKKRAEAIRLSVAEREEVRDRLLAYMEYHPASSRTVPRRVFPAFRFELWNVSYMTRLAGAAAVFVLVVVPALAEQALPGDALYPIKVRFNEEIRGAMTASPYKKVEWETARLERRLAEAQLLAENGKLTHAAEAEVALAVKHHTEAARANIDTIRASDSEEAALALMSLTSTLEVSAEVWQKREDNEGQSALSGVVREAREAISASPADKTVSYERLWSRVEAETTRAYEYLNSLGENVTAAERSDIDRRLADVKNKMDEARALHESDPEKGKAELEESLRSTQKLISFMTNLEVRRTVSVEELVPKVLTGAEKIEEVGLRIEEAGAMVGEVEEKSEALDIDENDRAALSATIAQYRELEVMAIEALEDGDIDKADEFSEEIHDLARALKKALSGLE